MFSILVNAQSLKLKLTFAVSTGDGSDGVGGVYGTKFLVIFCKQEGADLVIDGKGDVHGAKTDFEIRKIVKDSGTNGTAKAKARTLDLLYIMTSVQLPNQLSHLLQPQM